MSDMLIHLSLAAGFCLFVWASLAIKKKARRRKSPQVFRSMNMGAK